MVPPTREISGHLERTLPYCTSSSSSQALQELHASDNQITGDLEPLRGCKALQKLYLTYGTLYLTREIGLQAKHPSVGECSELAVPIY